MKKTIEDMESIMDLREAIALAEKTPDNIGQAIEADLRYQEFAKLIAFDVGQMLTEMQKCYASITEKESARETIGGKLDFTKLMELDNED